MKTIATTFGLSPDASEEAIHAEVTKLLSQARQSTEALTPLKNRVSELEASNAHLLAAQVESDLDLHQKRFPAAQRDAWKKQLLANRTATLELLSGLPEAAAQSTIGNRKSEMSPRIHNRETAVDPGSRLAAQSDAGTLLSVGCSSAQAAAIRNRATELRSADKSLSYSQAFDRARRELATR